MEIKRFFFSKTGMIAFFTAVILVFVFSPLSNQKIPLPFWFHEHFFNTLQIAENFKQLGFPTFDGMTPTNDFSPVLMLILTGLSALIPSDSILFFFSVRALLGLALGFSLLLFNRLIDALGFQPTSPARFFTLSLLTASFLYIGVTGSDAALVIPCLFLNALCLLKALKNPSFKSAAFWGLSLVLCVFTRFDSILFALTVALVFYFQFDRQHPIPIKQSLSLIPGLLVGLIPLLIWVCLLQINFDSPVPAGLASWSKAQDHAPWRLFAVLFFEPIRYIKQIPQALAVLSFPALVLGLAAYASFPWDEREQTPTDTVFYSLLWYPILYLIVISTVTFIALPDYAFYPLCIGGPTALLFAVCRIDQQISEKETEREKDQKQALRFWTVLGFCFCFTGIFLSLQPRCAVYKSITQIISEFTDKNPGIYAMSSGAGITSYVTNAKIVRLDGMAQDKQMLNFLDTQSDLNTVFKHYGVNYFIDVNPQAGKQGCYSAREPSQNRFGGSNKGMSDWLCTAPVFKKLSTAKINIGIFKINQDGKAVAE